MKERPIIFNAEMVKAILDGKKTQTRRPLDPQPHECHNSDLIYKDRLIGSSIECRSWKHLEYQEAYSVFPYSKTFIIDGVEFEANPLRVERVNDISEEDAIKEGVEKVTNGFKDYQNEGGNYCQAKHSFRSLWDSIYSKKFQWKSNPWVWVIEFRRVQE